MSIGKTFEESRNITIRNLIHEINGVLPVFMSAGNEGPGYNTLSHYVRYNPSDYYAITNLRDPAGTSQRPGWGINPEASRGTGNSGPMFALAGTNYRVANGNTNSAYSFMTGSSCSAAAMTGIFALCFDAGVSYGTYDIQLRYYDLGPTGYDKIYGHGRLSAYNSIKASAGREYDSSYSFSDGYTWARAHDYAPMNNSGEAYYYAIQVTRAGSLYACLLNLQETGSNIQLAVWGPGFSSWSYIENSSQQDEYINIYATPGIWYIGTNNQWSNNIEFSLDLTGYFQ